MDRRIFLRDAVALSMLGLVGGSYAATMSPVQLYLKREKTLQQIVGNPGSCIYGKLWAIASTRNLLTEPILSVEPAFCETMELPDRDNAACISLIPKGTYRATTETHAKLGWIIRLLDVKDRTNVHFHTGNIPQSVDGCILVGRRRNSNSDCSCLVLDSAKKPVYDANGCRIGGGPTSAEILKACSHTGVGLLESKAAMDALRMTVAPNTASVELSVTIAG